MNVGAQDHSFRFGVVTSPDGPEWLKRVHRVEELGYNTILMPDQPGVLSPFASLATAAAVSDLGIGTYVLAAPMHLPRVAAWEAYSLSVLSEGRFELGIGTGRRDSRAFARELGMPATSAAERRDLVEQTINHLHELDGKLHTPVMMGVGGPKSRALAARKADIAALAFRPLASRAEVKSMVEDLRLKAEDRADEIEISMNLFVVGDRWPTWIKEAIGVDATSLIAFDSLAILRGSPQAMADELRRRRDDYGATYIVVNHLFCEDLAPVIELLDE